MMARYIKKYSWLIILVYVLVVSSLWNAVTEHPYYITSKMAGKAVYFVSRAVWAQKGGNTKGAIRNLEKAYPIMKEKLPLADDELLTVEYFLGVLSFNEGNYKKTGIYLETALQRVNNINKGDTDVGINIRILLSLYYDKLGNKEKAKRYRNSVMDGPPPGLTMNKLLLCLLLLDDDRKDDAEKYLLEMIKSLKSEENINVEYLSTAISLLGALYFDNNDLEKAEKFGLEAYDVMKKEYGQDSNKMDNVAHNLGQYYYLTGDYLKSMKYNEQALSLRKKYLGPNHLHVSYSLRSLALGEAALDNHQAAYNHLLESFKIEKDFIDQILGLSSDEQKLKMLKAIGDYDTPLYLVCKYLKNNPNVVKEAFIFWLKRKGLVFTAQKIYQEALIKYADKNTKKLYHKLNEIRSRISFMIYERDQEMITSQWLDKLSKLKNEKNEIEAELSGISQQFAVFDKIRNADVKKIKEMMPRHSVLLEFSCINTADPRGEFKNKHHRKNKHPRYIVFVVNSATLKEIKLIDLGPAAPIDEVIQKFRLKISDRESWYDAEKVTEELKTLYRLVWNPIKTELGDADKIFISPDGVLSMVPFEIFLKPDGRYLIEDYTFYYLTSGKDILAFGRSQKSESPPLLIGDPDFNLSAEKAATARHQLGTIDDSFLNDHARSREMGRLYFKNLPATREEIDDIKPFLVKEDPKVYVGEQAIEEVVYQNPSPSLIHFATHAFILNDQHLEGIISGKFSDSISGLSSELPDYTSYFENPLLRCGLAMAGANTSLKGDQENLCNGLLTGEKILNLNLQGTEMIVLSACNTGQGEIMLGEGIFGLRRAFLQAGAKSLVMSMWSVPDIPTKDLMVEFYRNIYEKKLNRGQSLRQAALKMKNTHQMKGHTSPFLWGAFIYLGEP